MSDPRLCLLAKLQPSRATCRRRLVNGAAYAGPLRRHFRPTLTRVVNCVAVGGAAQSCRSQERQGQRIGQSMRPLARRGTQPKFPRARRTCRGGATMASWLGLIGCNGFMADERVISVVAGRQHTVRRRGRRAREQPRRAFGHSSRNCFGYGQTCAVAAKARLGSASGCRPETAMLAASLARAPHRRNATRRCADPWQTNRRRASTRPRSGSPLRPWWL